MQRQCQARVRKELVGGEVRCGEGSLLQAPQGLQASVGSMHLSVTTEGVLILQTWGPGALACAGAEGTLAAAPLQGWHVRGGLGGGTAGGAPGDSPQLAPSALCP